MKSRIVVGVLILIVALVIMAYLCVSKQPALSSEDPEKEYKKAVIYVEHGRYDKAIATFKKIIQENPGTDIAAMCHFELAGLYGFRLGDGAKMLQEYQTVASQYNGTKNGYLAESYLIDCQYRKNAAEYFNMWLQKKSDLIVKYGGISVFDILKSNEVNNHEWQDKMQTIPKEYGDLVIPDEYRDIANNLSDMTVQRLDDSLKLHMFVRIYFPRFVGSAKEIDAINTLVMRLKKVDTSNFPSDKTPPTIRPIAPRKDNSIGDTHPKIEVELEDGDISQTQVDLSKLIFTLDGEDLTNKMTVSSQINTSGQLGPVFEKIRIEYRPTIALAPGEHSVYVKAANAKGQSSEKTWCFIVK